MGRSWTGELAVTVLVWVTVLMGLWIAGPAPAQELPSYQPIEVLPEAVEGNERYLERGLIGTIGDALDEDFESDVPTSPTSGPAVGV